MFITRLISGIVLVVLALLFIIIGGPLLAAGLCAISIVGLFEILRVFGIHKSLLAIITYIFAGIYYLLLFLDFTEFIIPASIAYIMVLLCIYVFSYPKYRAGHVAKSIFSILYVAVMLSFIFMTRNLSGGVYMVWLIFLTSWGCDTCAYCVGKLIGKHKMSPNLSPKKSVEGAIGGVVGSVILTYIFCRIFQGGIGIDHTQILIISGLSAIGAFISMVGDLAASAIKRNYDIKDYGKLIPGHGGILDRFDSVIITAPIIFYLVYYTF